MLLKRRDTQTEVKHKILSDYLDSWAGIIVNGLAYRAKTQQSAGRPFSPRLVYIDGFSHTGRYLGDAGDLLVQRPNTAQPWGSPILGIQAMDRAKEFARKIHGFDIETAAVLVEDKPGYFEELVESLRLAGFSDRTSLNPKSIDPGSGRITAIQGDFHDYLDGVVSIIGKPYTWSFVFLDPYGPVGIPFTAVKLLVTQRNTDVMINFPYYDLHKKQGYLHKQQLTPAEQATLANYDAMFCSPEWRTQCQTVYQNRSGGERTQLMENELANTYLECLRLADPDLAVKHMRLRFPNREFSMFYLFLTTRDPSGALALNKVLSSAELTEFKLKWHYQQDLWISKSHDHGQMTLFDSGLLVDSPQKNAPPEIDIEALALAIRKEFQGRSVPKKTIYQFLANSNVFENHVERALTHLKRGGAATFDSKARLGDQIQFQQEEINL